MTRVEIWVPGTPAPKGSFRISQARPGSKRAFVVRKDSPATETWESAVKWAAKSQLRGAPVLEGAVRIDLVFVLPRDRDRLRRCTTCDGKRGGCSACGGAGVWRERIHADHEMAAVKPDIDKLQRSTLDALEGLVYRNDSRVVQGLILKTYPIPETRFDKPGALVIVRQIAQAELLRTLAEIGGAP